MATSYWDYIRVEDLLELQNGLEEDEAPLSNHEVLFVTVHQVFELWFKLILRELSTLRDFFNQDNVPEQDMALAAESLGRISTILNVAVKHFEVVETLHTRDYLDFRDKLFPASGFQSAQMREMEIILGLPDDERIGMGSASGYMQALRGVDGKGSSALDRVESRKADMPSLKAAVGEWLYRTPIRGSQPGDENDDAVVDGFLKDYLAQYEQAVERLKTHIRATVGEVADPDAFDRQYAREIESTAAFCQGDSPRERRIRAAIIFIESYRELPLLAWPRKVLARIVEMEQQLVMFRQRHARMVERVIGRRTGTGGSAGVDYLDQTATTYRIFKDLWAVRTIQIRRDDLPPLDEKGYYEFRAT
ncbi:MAG: tryptophan 2,3-dioxygenase family protein [Planctomycetota bacterium]|nr:tryptophan 2,3-dioxygenase family protein [Planctomycetota bacterium]